MSMIMEMSHLMNDTTIPFTDEPNDIESHLDRSKFAYILTQVTNLLRYSHHYTCSI